MKNKFIKYAKEITIFLVVMIIFANILSFYRSGAVSKEPLDLNRVTLLGDIPYELPKMSLYYFIFGPHGVLHVKLKHKTFKLFHKITMF